MKTRDLKQRPWWERIESISAGTATLLGVLAGGLMALLTYLPSFRDFPDGVLILVVLGGPVGYMFWLMGDPNREWRVMRIARPAALVAMIALLFWFPKPIWRLVHAQPWLSVALVGFMVALTMFLIATGWGAIHFATYLAAQPWRALRRSADPPHGGLWDRDLDQIP